MKKIRGLVRFLQNCEHSIRISANLCFNAEAWRIRLTFFHRKVTQYAFLSGCNYKTNVLKLPLLLCIFFVVLSCNTTNQPVPEPEIPIPSPVMEEAPPVPVFDPVVIEEKPEEPFDPSSITQEVFDEAKHEVQILIEELNQIIRRKDYTVWSGYLGQNYLDAISDPGFLARISASTRLANSRIVLEKPEDYFLNVVVPSRSNDRVDDIEFIGENQVKAFTVTPNGQRLRLYNLEKVKDSWKIIE